jgi:hypothetical protein
MPDLQHDGALLQAPATMPIDAFMPLLGSPDFRVMAYGQSSPTHLRHAT